MTITALFVDIIGKDSLVASAAITLCILGAALVLNRVLSFFGFIYKHFLRSGISARKLGPWAVVTGATDGIGKSYCIALAKKGVNLVLVSRTESKLQDVARELAGKYNIETKVVAADLTACTNAKYKEMQQLFDSLEIGLLINNAGISYDHTDFTDVVDEKLVHDLVEMNMVALTKLCRMVLPGMKKRRSGYIVNLSSGSGVLPACPLLSIYAATKAYVDCLSRSMDAEYRHMGIRVQSQAPFFIATKLAKIRHTSFTVPSASAYVSCAMKYIGYEPSVSPFWVHDLILRVAWAAPYDIVAARVFALHDGFRRRYYKKLAQQSKAE